MTFSLGLAVVALGLIAWLVILLVKAPKELCAERCFRKNNNLSAVR